MDSDQVPRVPRAIVASPAEVKQFTASIRDVMLQFSSKERGMHLMQMAANARKETFEFATTNTELLEMNAKLLAENAKLIAEVESLRSSNISLPNKFVVAQPAPPKRSTKPHASPKQSSSPAFKRQRTSYLDDTDLKAVDALFALSFSAL